MKRSVIRAIGVLAGLVTGLFLVPQPLLADLTSVHVSWDASQCPPGDYSLTSTAINAQTGESFQTASGRFNLPSEDIGQDFPDLPNGSYQVRASVEGTDGQWFRSAPQMLTIGPATPAPPIAGDSEDLGPQGPPTAPIAGSGQAPASKSGSPGGSNETLAAGGGATSGVAGPPEPQVQGDIPMGFALKLLAMFPAHLNSGDDSKLYVTAIDVDGDGTIDFISAISDSTVVTWRVVK